MAGGNAEVDAIAEDDARFVSTGSAFSKAIGAGIGTGGI